MQKLIIIFGALLAMRAQSQVIRATNEEISSADQAIPTLPAAGPMPRKDDMSSFFPPPQNQGQVNACVSYACTYYLFSYLNSRDNRRNYDYKSQNGNLNKGVVFSPFYSFFYKKSSTECSNCNSGVYQTLKFLRSNGAPFLNDFEKDPNNADYCNDAPGPTIDSLAVQNKIKNFAYIYSDLRPVQYKPTDLIKRFLLQKIPVIVILDIGDNFQNLKNLTSNFVWNVDVSRGQNWHAMVCTGYDLDNNALRFLNSYEENWGYENKIWISNKYVDEHIGEAYVVNIDKDLLIPSTTIKFEENSRPLPSKRFIDIYDKGFEQFDNFLISATKFSQKITEVKIIQKGPDNLNYIETRKLSKKSDNIEVNGKIYNINVSEEIKKTDQKFFDEHLKLEIKKISDSSNQ